LPERKIKTKTKAKTAHVAETTSKESSVLKLKRSRIPRSTLLSYDVSTLGAMSGCVASFTLKKADTGTWTGVFRMDFGDPGREKGACDLEVDTIETVACVASVSVGLGFFVRSKHISLFGCAKIGASAKEVGEGAGEGRKENACPQKPTILKNPSANERQSNQVS